MSTADLKDTFFTEETVKCWFHKIAWLQRCSFDLWKSEMLISQGYQGVGSVPWSHKFETLQIIPIWNKIAVIIDHYLLTIIS